MGTPLVFPIFPLSQVILVPGELLPLHIFEPRYRAMVADALEGPRAIAMAMPMPVPDGGDPMAPPVYGVCGLGTIVRYHPLPDGRSNVVLQGVHRMRIEHEVESGKPYRLVAAHPLDDVYPEDDDLGPRAQALLDRVARVSGEGREELIQLPPGRLLDVVLTRLPIDTYEKYLVHSDPDVASRLEKLERIVKRLETGPYPAEFEADDPRLN